MRGFQSVAIKCYSVIDLFKSRRKHDFIFTNAKVTAVARQVIVAIRLTTKFNQSVWIILDHLNYPCSPFIFFKLPKLSEHTVP